MVKTSLKSQETFAIARKTELGITGREYVRANDGSTRTPEKRALLQRIAKLAKAQGRTPPFTAAF